MPSFTPIDLSKVIFPDVIETLDFETILAEMKAKYLTYYPDYVFAESDPVTKAFEVAAYFRLQDRQRVNEAAKQNFIATATGSNLDNLVANLLVTRKADETDDELRIRAVSALEGFSTAGPAGAYYYHALSAHSDITDVGVSSPTPGQVQIVVLTKTGVPSIEVLNAVTAALNDEDVRPITDEVIVLPVEIIDYEINATIFTNDGADPALVIQLAQTRANEFVTSARKVGVDIPLSGIYANLHVSNTQKVILESPTADIPITELQCGNCTAINITYGGTDG